MARIRPSDIHKIRAEIEAAASVPIEPGKCSCRHHLCCEREGHKPSECPHPPVTERWTSRVEYFCDHCKEYLSGGSKEPKCMTTR